MGGKVALHVSRHMAISMTDRQQARDACVFRNHAVIVVITTQRQSRQRSNATRRYDWGPVEFLQGGISARIIQLRHKCTDLGETGV